MTEGSLEGCIYINHRDLTPNYQGKDPGKEHLRQFIISNIFRQPSRTDNAFLITHTATQEPTMYLLRGICCVKKGPNLSI